MGSGAMIRYCAQFSLRGQPSECLSSGITCFSSGKGRTIISIHHEFVSREFYWLIVINFVKDFFKIHIGYLL